MKTFLNRFANVIWLGIMTLFTCIMLYPILYSFLAGFMKKEEFQNVSGFLPLPSEIYLNNYLYIFSGEGYRPLINSIMRTLVLTIIILLMSCLVGYALSRLDFKGKNFFFMFIIVVQVIPWVLTTIPLFVLLSKMPFVGGNNWMGIGGHGLINSPLVNYIIIMPGNLMYIFLFRQAMNSLPRDFEEAADIDGCSFMRKMFQVILPLQKPTIMVIAISTAIWSWNDFLIPFIYINEMKYQTLMGYIGQLTTLLQQFGERNYPALFALASIATIPMLIMFFTLQKYIVEGLVSTGIKG